MKVRVLETRTSHDGFFRLLQTHLQYQRFDGTMSRPVVLESLERGEAVAVLLYDPHRDMVGLIRQFRIGPYLAEKKGWQMEIVAGACEGEQNYLDVARREVMEETGWKALSLELIQTFYLSPSAGTERIHLFLGLFDSNAPSGGGGLDHEDEDIKPFTMSFDEAWSCVASGEINASTPILAMQWLAMNRKRLQKEATNRKDRLS
ncbi:MAG: NUDIX domain-containing protein [Magnetococcales bacterium]|nr:NUDIX domain-containing protein [Magnetococcales bacterium]